MTHSYWTSIWFIDAELCTEFRYTIQYSPALAVNNNIERYTNYYYIDAGGLPYSASCVTIANTSVFSYSENVGWGRDQHVIPSLSAAGLLLAVGPEIERPIWGEHVEADCHLVTLVGAAMCLNVEPNRIVLFKPRRLINLVVHRQFTFEAETEAGLFVLMIVYRWSGCGGSRTIQTWIFTSC